MVGKYKVITLCGSTKFKDEFLREQKRLTLEGNISIINNGSNYYFHIDGSEQRSTHNFDVKYGKYAGYTVVGEDVFPRSLLTA